MSYFQFTYNSLSSHPKHPTKLTFVVMSDSKKSARAYADEDLMFEFAGKHMRKFSAPQIEDSTPEAYRAWQDEHGSANESLLDTVLFAFLESGNSLELFDELKCSLEVEASGKSKDEITALIRSAWIERKPFDLDEAIEQVLEAIRENDGYPSIVGDDMHDVLMNGIKKFFCEHLTSDYDLDNITHEMRSQQPITQLLLTEVRFSILNGAKYVTESYSENAADASESEGEKKSPQEVEAISTGINSSSDYLEQDKNAEELSTESVDEPSSVQENQSVDELQYLDVYLAIQDRLLARESQFCTPGEKSLCYEAMLPHIDDSTDIAKLCESIRELPYCAKMWHEDEAKALVESCGLDIPAYSEVYAAVEALCERKPESPFMADWLYKNVEAQLNTQADIDVDKVIDEINALKNPAVLKGTTCCQLVMQCKKVKESDVDGQLELDIYNKAVQAHLSKEEFEELYYEAVDKLKDVLSEFRRHTPNLDEAATLENICNVEFDDDNEMRKALLNMRLTRKLVRENLEFTNETGTPDSSNNELDIPLDATDSDIDDGLHELLNNDESFESSVDGNSDLDIVEECDPSDTPKSTETEQPKPPEPQCRYESVVQLNQDLDRLERGESLVIDGLANEIYHAANGYSKSNLDHIAVCPALVKWSKSAPVDRDKLKALDLGTAVHSALLEPELYEKSYAVAPDVNLRTKEGKTLLAEFEEECQLSGVHVLSKSDAQKIELMTTSALCHPNARVFDDGTAERSIFWREPESGLILKIRPDWVHVRNGQHVIVDVKTCAGDFSKSIEERRYHVQDAFYSWVYEQVTGFNPTFCFCVISSTAECGKYPVHIGGLDDYDKQVGRELYERDLRTLKVCVEQEKWHQFETFNRPVWARKRDNMEVVA